jgi:hypothetical protein
MWTRKPTLIGGKTAPDDWLVLCQGQACGRVYLTHSAVSEARTRMEWSALSYPGGHGPCETLEEGCHQVRDRIVADGGRMAGRGPDIAL